MKYVSYSRVSTQSQSLVRQDGGIDDYCKQNNIVLSEQYSDKITGKTFKRDNYLLMKQNLQKGDTLIILDLDRLGRNWDLIKEEWQWFMDNQINIIVVNMPLLNSNPNSNGVVSIDRKLIQGIVFDLMCYLSQKEVEKVSQRTKEALRVKKAQGVKLGRKPTYSDELIDNVLTDYEAGMKCADICAKYNISKSRLMVWRKQRGLMTRRNF